eukprot:SAG11_NODE_34566_length_271_cov_0.645349_1_plen_54_part_01
MYRLLFIIISKFTTVGLITYFSSPLVFRSVLFTKFTTEIRPTYLVDSDPNSDTA